MSDFAGTTEPEDERTDELLAHLGPRLRQLRKEQKLTLDMAAKRARVSRAMISKIERSEKMPTVGILVRLATALNVTLSSLLGAQPASAGVQVQRASNRVGFRDPASGLQREVVFSPAEGEGLELLRHVLPPRKSTGALSPYPVPTRKLVFSPSGPLLVRIENESYLLGVGDSLRFDVTSTYSFTNPGEEPVSYFLLVTRAS